MRRYSEHDAVGRWLQRHRRFQLQDTPTGSSWRNVVERWFRDITQKRIRRGSFRSEAELRTVFADYLPHNDQQLQPLVWTASVTKILENRAV